MWSSAALSLLAGCLVEATPEPPPPPPPPGVVLDLEGQVLDALGRPARFVPVRLGAAGGPVVATDETGIFVFPAVEEGEYTVYAFDRFEHHIAAGDHRLVYGNEYPFIIQLADCNDVLNDGGASDTEIVSICFNEVGIDLPPSVLNLTIDQLEYAGGVGDTNADNTATSVAVDDGSVREVFFSVYDGIGRGGVREFTIVNHRLEGADPGSDPFGEPIFHITTRDTNGHQRYTVRDGVFRLEVAEGDTATRAYVLTGTSLVLDYGEPLGPYDPRYTLSVASLRLEGTLDVDLPPPPPAGDIDLALVDPYFFANYSPGRDALQLTFVGGGQVLGGIALDPAELPLPGTIEVELPAGDVPDLQRDSLSIPSDQGSSWDFQLVSYTLSTEMTELPGCNDQLRLRLENLVFRFVGWDYDANSDRVDSFGEQTLTIDRMDVDALVVDTTPGAC